MYLVNINGHIEKGLTYDEARELCEHVQLENQINGWGYKTLYLQQYSTSHDKHAIKIYYI